jgi:2-aminoadipate transaminase
MATPDGSPTAEAARRWSARELDALLSAPVRALTAGTATDWGLPASAWDPVAGTISLAAGMPDPASLPRAELLEALRGALTSADDGPLSYGGGLGLERLREQLAERSTRALGLPATAEHFMLVNGSAGGIAAVCDAVLDPGDVVVTEAPTFSGSLRTIRGHEAELVPVGMDADGLDTDELAATLERLRAEGRRVKLIYTISSFQNPTGTTLSLERRRELVRLASAHGALILDDDAYGEIHFDAERPPALAAIAEGRGVVTVGTFSKTVATGLRVGWLQADPALVERLSRVRFDMGNSPLLHHMLHALIASGGYAEHVARLRPVYASKAEALQRSLRKHVESYATFRAPRGGFFLWLELRPGLTAEAVQRAAIEEGVVFPVGHAFFPDRRDPGGEHVRLAFSTASLEELAEAGARIARACERVAQSDAAAAAAGG